MSRASIEMVERLYDAFRRSSTPAIFSRLAADAEMAQSTDLPRVLLLLTTEAFRLGAFDEAKRCIRGGAL